MSDEQDVPMTDEQVPGAAPEAGDAWSDVMAQFEALGAAVGRWAKAAVNDPDNKRRVDELKVGLENVASSIGDAADKAADTEVGQSFKEAAGKTGEAFKVAGHKFGTDVAPHIAGAFKTASEKLREAAGRMEQKTDAPEQGAAPEDDPSGPSA